MSNCERVFKDYNNTCVAVGVYCMFNPCINVGIVVQIWRGHCCVGIVSDSYVRGIYFVCTYFFYCSILV